MTNETNEIKKSYKGFNIASFVCGICGFFFLWFILGPLAIIFAGVASAKKQRNGLGTTGMVLGIVCTSVMVLFLAIGATLLGTYIKYLF